MASKEVIELSGKFYKDKYLPNRELTRDDLIRQVDRLAKKHTYSFFSKIRQPYIVHLDRQFTTNFYFRDWIRIMPILKNYYGEGTFYIVNGFRSPFELGSTVHSSGLAMDILVKDREDAERLMSAAYMTGIPTIIPAGNIAAGQGHVHLDLAPKPNYAYDAGTYHGPWGRV